MSFPLLPSINQQIPSTLRQFYNAHNYQLLEKNNIDEDLLYKNSADTFVSKCGSLFIESIIMFDDLFIFVTSLDAFLHHGIDDCAYGLKDVFEKPKVRIKERVLMDKSYYEISIFWGRLELIIGSIIGSRTTGTIRWIISSYLLSKYRDHNEQLQQYILFMYIY